MLTSTLQTFCCALKHNGWPESPHSSCNARIDNTRVIAEAATGTERLLNVVERTVRANNDLSGLGRHMEAPGNEVERFKEDLQMTSTAGDTL